MVPVEKVIANEWNPNNVQSTEMDLLAISMEEDGVTQPVVVFYDVEVDLYILTDGFHRYSLMKDYFQCKEIPVVVVNKPIQDRMASTIRHNRARGKHKVDMMSVLVEKLLGLGWNDHEIAKHLGMEAEEVLRLKQMTGLAGLFRNQEYSRSWIRDERGEHDTGDNGYRPEEIESDV